MAWDLASTINCWWLAPWLSKLWAVNVFLFPTLYRSPNMRLPVVLVVNRGVRAA
jgi:hypothetical protein